MIIKNNPSQNSVIPRVEAITPYKMYMYQVKNVTDGVRASTASLSYIPNQYGGIFGQHAAFREKVALQSIEFTMN